MTHCRSGGTTAIAAATVIVVGRPAAKQLGIETWDPAATAIHASSETTDGVALAQANHQFLPLARSMRTIEA